MSAYLRDKFSFWGLQRDKRLEVAKAFWATHPKPEGEALRAVVLTIFDSTNYRELHYVALDLADRQIKKLPEDWIETCEQLIQKKSWWDTVDYIVPRLLGTLFQRFPKAIPTYTEKWIKSDNIWLQRAAILFQLKWKTKTDFVRLSDYILRRASSKEFFVQKASGWALREYSKTEPQKVVDFIRANEQKLSTLTVQQGLKWLKDKGRLGEFDDR